MKKWEKKLSIFTICGMILAIVIGFTYAAWTSDFTQADVNTNTYDCFEITFNEKQSEVVQLNSYPQTDASGLTNLPYTLTVTNVCETPVVYNVVLHQMSTSTLNERHVKVAVNEMTKLLSEQETLESTIAGVKTAYNIGIGILNAKETKNINVQSWMDENTSQADGENKRFDFKIRIEAQAGNSNLLASKVLSTSILEGTPDYSVGEPTGDTFESSGLYKTIDEKGESFYYRGRVTNNYVNFAGFIWRIVRVNGDGSIRLIVNEKVGESEFNTSVDAHKYAGYTYDNSAANVQDGTPSTIKSYLDDWYNEKLLKYDNMISLGTFCNDTNIYSGSGNPYFYETYSRLTKYVPSLICSDSTQNYGGKYVLKVGLLSADEIMMAGLKKISGTTSTANYLYKSYFWWTMSPRHSYTDRVRIYASRGSMFSYYGAETTTYGVRPVINLKANTLVRKGSGTSSDPYIIR